MELYKSHLMVFAGICVEIYARFRHNAAIDSADRGNKTCFNGILNRFNVSIDAEKDFVLVGDAVDAFV